MTHMQAVLRRIGGQFTDSFVTHRQAVYLQFIVYLLSICVYVFLVHLSIGVSFFIVISISFKFNLINSESNFIITFVYEPITLITFVYQPITLYFILILFNYSLAVAVIFMPLWLTWLRLFIFRQLFTLVVTLIGYLPITRYYRRILEKQRINKTQILLKIYLNFISDYKLL